MSLLDWQDPQKKSLMLVGITTEKAILERLSDNGLYESTLQERIDWLSVQKNIIVEISGRSDQLIYIVAHYDKADLNLLKILVII